MRPGDKGGHDLPFREREVWPAGTIKGDFLIEKKLGGGGFGTVYLATHRYFKSTHVIKRLHDEYASDKDFVRKFYNEGLAVRRLKGCPYIVEVEHMTQSDDGYLILVMEYVSGGDLAHAMKGRTFPVAEAADYGMQIALGLEAAHKAGLIHRDIKPENVMMSQDSSGKPLLKLIDFGIAADHQNQNQPTSVMRGGSVGYAAPEQWKQAGKTLDGRTDLYALGATMYRMLCGRLPFQEVAHDVWAWLQRVEQGPPVAVASLRKDCPKALSDLIQELLAEKPEGRPASAGVVAQRLRTVLIPETAPPPPPHYVKTIPLGEQRKTTEVIPPHIPEGPGTTKSGPWIWGALALASVITAGVIFYPNPEPKPPPEPVVKKEDLPVVTKKVEPLVVEPPKPVTPEKKEKKQEKQKQAAVKPEPPAAAVATVPPADPPKAPVVTVDHIALGDSARNAGDMKAAVQHYRQAGNAAKLAGVQRAVEGDVDERAAVFMGRGQFNESLQLVEGWLREFPESQRLQRLRVKIERARASQ